MEPAYIPCPGLCSGAFKIRGACNAVMSLSDAEAAKGVITHRCEPEPRAFGLRFLSGPAQSLDEPIPTEPRDPFMHLSM